MGILSFVGCSASGERLVSAASDGDFQEARALLECNPRLARYSTFSGRDSPLHHAAAKGHLEIVLLLLDSGVDINLPNYWGQTALMQACRRGHREVVQALMLSRADIHRADLLNGYRALHFAAIGGNARCIRLILADYVPSRGDFWHSMRNISADEPFIQDSDENALVKVVNQKAHGGLTALHCAALRGHVECVQLLLDFGANVSEVTVADGTTVDSIGPGSTPLHYAASAGNPDCCQLLIARGGSLTAVNENGLTPLMVANSMNRTLLADILSNGVEVPIRVLPSPYLCLPLMSIMNIAREYGCRYSNPSSTCNEAETCYVCLERCCTVAIEGCNHALCTSCALSLCSTNNTTATSSNPPGTIPCPFCRNPITLFVALPGMSPPRESPRLSLSLSLCNACPAVNSESMTPPSSQAAGAAVQPSTSQPLQPLACPPMRFYPSICMGMFDTNPCLLRCSRMGSGMRRTSLQGDSSRQDDSFAFDTVVAAENG